VATGSTRTNIRLAELLAVLSLGADLGLNQPMEHVLRQSLIALRLGERLGLDDAQRGVLYYSSLIAWVGCHVDAYEQAKWFGDDQALKEDARLLDIGGKDTLKYMRTYFGGVNRPVLERVKVGAAFITGGFRDASVMLQNHWYAANDLCIRLGLGDDVRESVHQSFERWDGKGPGKLKADAIDITSRIVQLADVVEVFHRAVGVDAARDVARERSGTQFDPGLVDSFCRDADLVFSDLDAATTWDAIIDAEPALQPALTDEEFCIALDALADFTDVKSPYTLGHSRGVAELVAGAARAMNLASDEVEQLRRAALVHDLGKLGVSNAIWDKPGSLTAGEQERVRIHPYLTERMLASSPALAPLGAIAFQHHERLDGSGYPRGLSGSAITPAGRLLAAADMYRGRREPRPHREAKSADEAAADLRAEVKAGRLDGAAVEAVLQAAGHAVKRRQEYPAGLTGREVEVLRLLARGLSNKEIAQRLVISRKTASNHIEHIYTKLDVTNRARASLLAAKYGLMTDLDD
jgi:HD-GYP domain-containing protein (c-di-GMP phosphodiesterase class II)